MNKTLPIANYLNQKTVFDILAVIDDGFTQVTNFTISNQESGKNNVSGEATLGMKNAFGLFNFSTKLAGTREKSKTENDSSSGEKVHTPTSLFIKLLTYLEDEEMIKDIKKDSDLEYLKSGDFVRFKGQLETNPLISVLDSFIQLGELATLFTSGNKRKKDDEIISQMKKVKGSLTQNNMLDLICKVNSSDVKAVIPVSLDYFFKENMNDIVDGNYTVFGKVVKVVVKEGDNINLYRNTGFKHFKEDKIDEMFSAFGNASVDGFDIPDISSKINNPSLLVIPIAIYS